MSVCLSPYPEYKDSGVEWLGKIPTHWDVKRLDRLFILRNEAPQEDDGRVTGYLDGRVTLRSNVAGQKIKGVVKEAGWQRIHPGDFAISGMNAHLGGMGVSDSLGKCSPIYLVLEPRENTNPYFVSHAVRYIAHTGLLKTLVNTIRFNSADFKRDDLKQISVWLPSSEEQQQIVQFIGSINGRANRLIRTKRRLIELLQEQKQAIIHRAVTRGLDPDVRLKPSGVEWLGDIPEHWTTRKLKHTVHIYGGMTPSKDRSDFWTGSIPWASPKDMKVDELHDTALHISQEAVEQTGVSLITPPAVLVVVRGMILARTFPTTVTTHPVTINQDMKALRPTPVINANFLRLSLVGARTRVLKDIEEAGHGTRCLRTDKLHDLQLPLPPLLEQEAIVDRITHATLEANEAITRTQREIELIREYRTRLIADVVTGKLDVRGVALPELDEVEVEDVEDDETDGPDADGEAEE